MKILILFSVFLLPISLTHGANIAKWVDANGVTHYSNVPGDGPAKGSKQVAYMPSEQKSQSRATVYKFRDNQGITHYTDIKPKHNDYVVVSVYCPACDPHSTVNWSSTFLNLSAYAAEIEQAASDNGIDPALVRAVIHAESAFNPAALSRKGAQGLMQLMPALASEYGVTDPFNAIENIKAGTKHLASLLQKYNGDERLATAAYNAGAGAVQRYGDVPPYAETKLYVERVGILRKRYKQGS